MSRKVQVTVVVTRPGHPSTVESKTLLMDGVPSKDDFRHIVGGTAALLGEKAWYGRLLPTPAREGGRG